MCERERERERESERKVRERERGLKRGTNNKVLSPSTNKNVTFFVRSLQSCINFPGAGAGDPQSQSFSLSHTLLLLLSRKKARETQMLHAGGGSRRHELMTSSRLVKHISLPLSLAFAGRLYF